MREIKFRGKRFDNNHDDWIYGYLHIIDTCGEGYSGKAIQQQCGTSRPYSVRVHSESVGEFTGLKDKNGKEIHEGDICFVSNCYQKHMLVEFIEGGFCLTSPEIKNYPIDINTFYPSIGCQLEIIGNIYEKPELLEKTK